MHGQLSVIYVARHGDTAWTITGQHTGLTNLPLTSQGEDHARALKERLNDIAFANVFTSPLLRARTTCTLAGYGSVAEIDNDLAEWDYGKYKGSRLAEIHAERPDWDLFQDGAPGGETPAQVAERADNIWKRVSSIGGNVLLFSSGYFIRVLAARWVGLMPSRHCSSVVLGNGQPERQGQLWGNPIYNWKALKSVGYRWCLDRLRALLEFVDVIRLDHFRGFVAAWQVPAVAPTAETGAWVDGPGADFLEAVRHDFGGMPFIAEDLGMITPDVLALRDSFGLSGMRVMQFGFDGNPENPHLPHSWTSRTVAYTGTRDNNTTRGWFEALPQGQKWLVQKYVGSSAEDGHGIATALMRSAWPSAAGLTIAPLQDVLNLGAEGRMNAPGRAQGNWRWRWANSAPSQQAFRCLAELTSTAGRTRNPQPPAVAVNRAVES